MDNIGGPTIGIVLLLLIFSGLAIVHLRKQTGSPFPFVLLGVLLGGVIGVLLTWPTVIGHPIPLKDFLDIVSHAGTDETGIFKGLVLPTLIKSAICAAIGGVGGYLVFKVRSPEN